MNCGTAIMPRKRRSFMLDERVIDVLAKAAQRKNVSANRYLENLLFLHGKQIGEIDDDAQPLGELRGGDRTATEQESAHTEKILKFQ
jgi:hypothetical protein